MGHASLPWCPLCCQRGLSPIPHGVAGSLASVQLGAALVYPSSILHRHAVVDQIARSAALSARYFFSGTEYPAGCES